MSKEIRRTDKRKIPKLFRAVERDSRPQTFYGVLIDDDGFNFVSYSSHDGDETHFRERVLPKNEYKFSVLNKSDFEIHTRRALHFMKKKVDDAKLEFEAAEYKHLFASEKLAELMGKL